MIKGFKEFILRGNVIDLAVAVVIGAAFSAVVNAIVSAIITPLIEVSTKPTATSGHHPDPAGGYSTFEFGAVLLTAIISFFAVAIVVYLVFVYPMNRWKAIAAARAGVEQGGRRGAALPTEQELLVQIRDLLERQNKL